MPITRGGIWRSTLAATAREWHWVVVGLVVTLRTATLGMSGWPIHQGYGEVLYTGIAASRQEFPDGLSVLPMRYLPLRLSFWIFGESEWSARLPGMAALVVSCVVAGRLGLRFANEFGRRWAPIFFVTNPWVLVWYGRAMPDAWLATALLLCGLVALESRERPWMAALFGPAFMLGVAAKPTGVLALAMLFLLRTRAAFLISIGSMGLIGLTFAAITTHGHPWRLAERLLLLIGTRSQASERFDDVSNMVGGGFVLGMAGVAWFGALQRPTDESVPLAAFAFYALWDALPNHAYYALPVAAWASVLAVRWFVKRPQMVGWALAITVVTAPLALYDTGSLGDDRTRIVEAFPFNATVAIPVHLGPMFEYYRPDLHFVADAKPATFLVSYVANAECIELGVRSYGLQRIFAYECPELDA